jgi:hypothetical protein
VTGGENEKESDDDNDGRRLRGLTDNDSSGSFMRRLPEDGARGSRRI